MIEIVSNRYLGGIAEPSQRAKMAESGRRILQFVADNDFKTAVDPILFQSEVRPMGTARRSLGRGLSHDPGRARVYWRDTSVA